MKFNFIDMRIATFLLFICLGFACKNRQAAYIRYNIDDANKLGIDDESNLEAFGWNTGGYSGVMLKIPSGGMLNSNGDSIYTSSYYIDATEVCNLHYRTFIEWNKYVFEDMPSIAVSLLPDTTIWLKEFPNEAIGGLLKDNYFRAPAFDYYPVVGITWEQAQAYAFWRSDRINEAILVYRKHMSADFQAQKGESHFSTFNYLEAMYEGTPGEKPMVNPITKEERRVQKSDGILLPYYRLPTQSELDYAATQPHKKLKNKELEAFKRKIAAHNKKHPMPAYYDHSQYNLPYSVAENSTNNAPFHLEDNVAEWTQQYHNTSEEYNMHYVTYDMHRRAESIYMVIWAKKFYTSIDTNIINKFAQQHTIKNTSPYKGFRCVMPNIW